MIVTRCIPLADLAFALLRKFFVPGSNPASAGLLTAIGELNFVQDGEIKLAVPVGNLQAALSSCRQQGVSVDWDRAYRLLVGNLSEAGNMRLELPSDGKTPFWSALARDHAGRVLARGPTSPFPAVAIEDLLGQLTEFARLQSLSELTFKKACESLRGLARETVNRVGRAGTPQGGARHASRLSAPGRARVLIADERTLLGIWFALTRRANGSARASGFARPAASRPR